MLNCPVKGEELRRAVTESRKEFLLAKQEEEDVLDGEFIEDEDGSRVRFELNGVVATFHQPHPDKEAKPYQVRDARAFLEQAGVTP
jgi:hypothetical protein